MYVYKQEPCQISWPTTNFGYQISKLLCYNDIDHTSFFIDDWTKRYGVGYSAQNCILLTHPEKKTSGMYHFDAIRRSFFS
jgi:hypothetical protein